MKYILVSLCRFLLVTLGFSAVAYACTPPAQSKRLEVEDYVMKRNHVMSKADIILTESDQANEACFWKFTYNIAPSNREITIYLSPDGRYMTPILYDITINPAIEERQRIQDAMRSLNSGVHPSIGPENAPTTIVLFSDFQCPFCKRFEDVLEKEVIPKSDGKVRLVFRNYPLPMHSWATPAALVAKCVEQQSPAKFWQLHDYVFEHQGALNSANLKQSFQTYIQDDLGLDEGEIDKCVALPETRTEIQNDVSVGTKLGVHATPSYFINGVMYTGYKSANEVHKLIEQAQPPGPQEQTTTASR